MDIYSVLPDYGLGATSDEIWSSIFFDDSNGTTTYKIVEERYLCNPTCNPVNSSKLSSGDSIMFDLNAYGDKPNEPVKWPPAGSQKWYVYHGDRNFFMFSLDVTIVDCEDLVIDTPEYTRVGGTVTVSEPIYSSGGVQSDRCELTPKVTDRATGEEVSVDYDG